jgi:shikimate kinase
MNKNKIVISTGGGLIIRNLKQLKLSFNIYLYCDLDILTIRASRNNLRPLLNEDLSLQMKNLFNERKEIYESAADITINATDNTRSTINEILKEISNDN